MKRRWLAALSIAVLCVVAVAAPRSQSKRHVWSTWQYVELDKAASTWLIKRFVDKKAEFKVFRKGTLIREGTAFDTPDSEFRRNRNITTFESILRKYKIEDPALDYIGKIVWDIEVNVWDKKTTPESRGVNAVIRGLSRICNDDLKCFEKSWPVFDALYAEVKATR